MDDDLPDEFDLIVIGTGFSESVIAAAASRIGKRVLHLDPNDFYGGIWASFNLEAFISFIEKSKTASENAYNITENNAKVKEATQKWYIPKKGGDDINEDDWTEEKVLEHFRKFNIDLSPKLLFGSGKLVELLISSNICRYAEFRAVDRICTIFDNQVKSVPCSRNDVFNSKDLNIVEKRLLMKLLTNCMSYDEHPEEFAEYEGKTFLEYLKGNKLTESIIHCVLQAISMSNEDTPLKDGIARTKKFLQSLGRYGNTPFLFPMYGCGEIPQCFCRLCAVFGGIYCLKRPIDDIAVLKNDEDKTSLSIKCGNQKIKAQNIVISSENVPFTSTENVVVEENGEKRCGGLSRAIFITSTPIGDAEINSGGGGVNLLRLPGIGTSTGALLIQLSHYSLTCPKGLYLIHITSESITGNAENDLKPYVDQVFEKDFSPKVLYCAYYSIPVCKKCETKLDYDSPGVYITCGPYFELDYDLSIDNAKTIFSSIYPGEEFLPRAPDPEEIILGDEDPVAVNNEEISEENVKEQQEGDEHQ